MGREVETRTHDGQEYLFEFVRAERDGYRSLDQLLPSYSEDMNAAMEVAKEMRMRGFNITICSSPIDAPSIQWYVQYGKAGMVPPYEYVQADTPALAICLTALEAVKK